MRVNFLESAVLIGTDKKMNCVKSGDCVVPYEPNECTFKDIGDSQKELKEIFKKKLGTPPYKIDKIFAYSNDRNNVPYFSFLNGSKILVAPAGRFKKYIEKK
jgi:hypothetical protein